MSPKRRSISKSDVDTESLKTAVFKERVIWDEKDPNHGNEYLVNKAWHKLAATLKFTKQSIMKRWAELLAEQKDLHRKEPHLTSGSAAGNASRLSDSLHYADQLGFLKDKHTPVVETAGNLDGLMNNPTTTAVVVKSETPYQSSGTVIEVKSVVVELTDTQFLSSLLKPISHLSDEEKINVRIEIMDQLEQRSAKMDLSSDEDEIKVLGSWMPDVKHARQICKKEK